MKTQLSTQSIKNILKYAGITIKNEIRKSMSDNTVVGFSCVATSVIRKQHTVNELKKFISENSMPLFVEAGSDHNNQFKVSIINEVPSAIDEAQKIVDQFLKSEYPTEYLVATIAESLISYHEKIDFYLHSTAA